MDDMYGEIRIHAPHHSQKINPCAPELYPTGDSHETRQYIEEAMYQTFEAADRTGSDIIVLHAGRYLQGNLEESVHTFHEFLDQYPDERYILENLPDLKVQPQFLGTSPEELRTISEGKFQGFCIDFPHLWCTSISQGRSYQDYLSEMSKLPIKFSHLSGTHGPLSDRQHLLFDDPENQYDLHLIKGFLTKHPDLEISLEFSHDDPEIIREQIAFLKKYL